MDITKKIPGTSIIEAVAAMAIVSIILATAFSLYAQIVQSKKTVLKTYAGIDMLEIETNAYMEGPVEETDNATYGLTTDIESNVVTDNPGLWQFAILASDKSGKNVKEFRILKFKQP